jgi:hypothetical protein
MLNVLNKEEQLLVNVLGIILATLTLNASQSALSMQNVQMTRLA